MKIDAKKQVTVTLTLTSTEAIALAQLAIQPSGDNQRASFYRSFYQDMLDALHNIGEEMPLARPFFRGKLIAFDDPQPDEQATASRLPNPDGGL